MRRPPPTARTPARPQDPQDAQLALGVRLDPADASDLLVLRGAEVDAHQLVFGLTGSGKSGCVGTQVPQLMNQGRCVMLIDPHGDTCNTALSSLLDSGYFSRPAAFERLWYIDLAHPDRALPWNVLDRRAGGDAHTIAQQLVEAWRRAWPTIGAGNAPLLETILLATTYVLAENDRPLTELSLLLSEPDYRDALLARVPDQEVARFVRRFTGMGARASTLAESTLRRAFLLTFSPMLRDCLGQQTNRLHFRALMDRGVSVFFNLAGLDEEIKRFVGCLLTVQLEVAALSRADLPAGARRPVHVFIDEFPVFASRSATAVEHLLSQTRKYAVYLTLACQTWGQARILRLALQNAQLLTTFRLGPEDAAWAAPRLFTPDPYRVKHIVDNPNRAASMHPVYMSLSEQRTEWEQWLQHLPAREAYASFSGTTVRFRTLWLPPARHEQWVLDALKREYARRLLTPRPRHTAQPVHVLPPNYLVEHAPQGALGRLPPVRWGQAHRRVASLDEDQDADQDADHDVGEGER